ncbi:hypothetical protein SUSAZ_10090 [Sulfolobus acidocaldarius SUSAZ]|nr:hypothetical protein SUSAZ_10090 [Sulfolobus acidocaldarius SUSAZ]
MRIIETVKLDKIDSCGSKSPLMIMLTAIKKIQECGEAVEILMNDYDWYVSLKYILQVNDLNLKIEDKGKENGFMKVDVVREC